MPQNTHNTISQTALKHYNQLRSVRTEALQLIQLITDLRSKLQVETYTQHKDQQPLEFTPIGIIQVDKQPS